MSRLGHFSERIGAQFDTNISHRHPATRARLAAVLLGSLSTIVLLTLWALPDGVDRAPLTVWAGAGIALGVAVRFVRWQRLPAVTLPILVVAYMLGSGLAWMAADATRYYIGFFSVVFVYIGLTQPPRVAIGFGPLAIIVVLVSLGDPGREAAIELAVLGPTWVLIGEVLSRVTRQRHRVEDTFDAMLTSLVALGAAREEDEVINQVCELTSQLTGCDTSVALVADGVQPPRVRAITGHALVAQAAELDMRRAPEAFEAAVTAEVIRDIRRSPFDSMARAGVQSAAFVELEAGGVSMGYVVAAWDSPQPRVGPLAARTWPTLAATSARLLHQIREAHRLASDARTDPLTGLENRRVYDVAVSTLSPGDAVVLVDLDHFKKVNDTYGHGVGDEVLRALARCLATARRRHDTVARQGGEEFSLVLRGAGADGALAAVERLQEQWRDSDPLTTFSAGIAIHGIGEDSSRTVERADAALYAAKEQGRDRVVVDLEPRQTSPQSSG